MLDGSDFCNKSEQRGVRKSEDLRRKRGVGGDLPHQEIEIRVVLRNEVQHAEHNRWEGWMFARFISLGERLSVVTGDTSVRCTLRQVVPEF